MHNARVGSVSGSKTDKPKDCGPAAAANFPSPTPESRHVAMDTAWPDNCDPPPKSKGKSVKLKKISKTESSKKLIRQGSKDSVVLVGYKNLKSPHGEPSTKYKEEEPPLNQEEEKDTLLGDWSSHLRTDANFLFEASASSTTLSGPSDIDTLADDNITSVACQKSDSNNLMSLDAQNKPQAGTGAAAIHSQAMHKDEPVDHYSQKPPQRPAGLRHIEVKPSDKDPYRGDKVTVLLPCRTDGAPGIPEITQTYLCDSKRSAVDSVFERPGKETAEPSRPRLVPLQVKGDCIRLPDAGVPSASSRLSDSGIESEPSSFAAQLAPGPQGGGGGAGLGGAEPEGASQQPERPLFSPVLQPVQPSSAQKAGGAGEGLYPESTSAVSGVQSSLTSINSLPSDDEGESSSGAEVRGRKSSILVQEQSVVFSDSTARCPAPAQPHHLVACNPETSMGNSQPPRLSSELETDPRLINVSDVVLEGAAGPAGPAAVRESRSEPPTACPSSNSATSSTDLVKRGMVENYFGSRSSTDVSEISPVETSAITLGIQSGAACGGEEEDDEEDETEHEMIENGYYEEGDGYTFVNGDTDEDRDGDAIAQETKLLFEQLGLGHLQEPKDLLRASICSPLASGSVGGCSQGRPPCPPASLSSSLRWYESAPTLQMKA